MRKTGFLALLTAGLLLLSSCSGKGETYLFGDGGHVHVYGEWYDVTPVNCLDEGEHVCYCKICGESYTEKIPVATDIAARQHTFEDTVTPPTEALEGFTRRVCRLCGFVVERADIVPARYALPLPGEDLILAGGLTAQLFFNTVRGDTGGITVRGAQNPALAVSARPALYLAAALVTAEAAGAGELSFEERVTITAAHLAGREHGGLEEGVSVSVRELVKLCLEGDSGADVAVAALAERLSGNETAFAGRLNGRMAVLGVRNTVFSGISGEVGSTTLAETAVLLWRVLEQPEAEALAFRGVSFGKNGEKPCAVSLTAGGFRIVAVRCTAESPEGGEPAARTYFEILAFAADPLPSVPSLNIF